MDGRSPSPRYRLAARWALGLALVASVQANGAAPAAVPGPDGEIAFVQTSQTGSTVAVVTAAGESLDTLAEGLSALGPRSPAWSPTGRHIALFTQADATLHVIDRTDGSVDSLGVGGRAPEWSPTGDRLVFEAPVPGGRSQLFLVNVDDRSATQLTTADTIAAAEPSWSPDGSLVAFSGTESVQVGTDRQGNPVYAERESIFTFAVDGSGYDRLAGFDGARYGNPDWAPDGKSVVFDSDATGASQIHRVDVATKVVTQVTTGGGMDPAWSPSGAEIVYALGGRIETIDLETLQVTDVSGDLCGGTFACSGPDWGVPPPIVGTPGDDELVGTPGNDVLVGGDGDDVIVGAGGRDVIKGGEGNDTLYGDGSASGEYAAASGGGADAIHGGGGDDVVLSGPGADLVVGASGLDTIAMSAGNDIAHSGGGPDEIDGGDGTDALWGEGGNDRLRDTKGRKNKFYGGRGTDTCRSGSRSDSFFSCERQRKTR